MSSPMPPASLIDIRDVWAENLDEEIELIRQTVDRYNWIAMDTEYPGTVLKVAGVFNDKTDETYSSMRENVNAMKLIQLGLTFTDINGNLPTFGTPSKYCIWQFNFREFDPRTDDLCNPDSIKLLRNSDIDFEKNNEKGIDATKFGEVLMSLGVVLNDEVYWVTFHGGYDLGYLLKILTGRGLPESQQGFFELIELCFGKVYDVKHLMLRTSNLRRGGLNKLAGALKVERVGTVHQAGSDSLLTSFTYRKLIEQHFGGSAEEHAGVLYGLGAAYSRPM